MSLMGKPSVISTDEAIEIAVQDLVPHNDDVAQDLHNSCESRARLMSHLNVQNGWDRELYVSCLTHAACMLSCRIAMQTVALRRILRDEAQLAHARRIPSRDSIEARRDGHLERRMRALDLSLIHI